MRGGPSRDRRGWTFILFAGLGLVGALAVLGATRPPKPAPNSESSGPQATDSMGAAPDGAQGPFFPWQGEPGVTVSVEELMTRDRAAQSLGPVRVRAMREHPPRELPLPQDPDALPVSQWPPPDGRAMAQTESLQPESPQIGYLSFTAISLLAPHESQWIPPDSMGDVGPNQIIAVANGRIKAFTKTGLFGALNVTLEAFFGSVSNGAGVSDPQLRFDRLSQRWWVTAITTSAPNRILIAVSSGAEVTSTSSFTFFFFQHDLVGTTPNLDTGGFADYDSLGVDRLALYIGTNTFNAAGTNRLGSTGFVVNKASLIAGSLSVTAFRALNTAGSSSGPYSPRGVDNDDPAATEGYFIGVDNSVFGRLVVRRVSNPGGSPSISGNINITVPSTNLPILVPHAGMASATRKLDALDDRLFAARLHSNKLTGVASLWTAHNIQVNSSGVASSSGGRNGSRWYQIGSLSSTPILLMAGTLFDSAATDPRFFWIPTVAANGQGHMALGCSTAGTIYRIDSASAGRLSSDAPGTIQSFTQLSGSFSAYNQQPVNGQRWGDYSSTVVDPSDDQTIWTFQEYCDATNSWGVFVTQLKGPPPATPATAGSVCSGLPSVSSQVIGTVVSGSGFFDPGPDTGGPGYPGHISALISGGVTVNGVNFTSPTQVTLDLNTTAASPGAQDVSIINPDGLSQTGTAILTVLPAPAAPSVSSNSPLCEGQGLQLSAPTLPGVTYSWTGPNGFSSSAQNPLIPAATPANAGIYRLRTQLAGGCASQAGETLVSVSPELGACNDADACTQTDTCQAGVCTGANPVVCAASDTCHQAGTCDSGSGVCSNPASPDGSPCSDADACTQSDTCEAGICTGSNPILCSASDPCHDAGTCDAGTGVCSNPPKPDGTTCTDGNACTQTDTCEAGICTGSNSIVCTPTNECHEAGLCDAGSGICSDPVKPDGATCEDGNPCTLPDTCQAGACQSGPPTDFDADAHVNGLCGGDDCNDTNPLVWQSPLEVGNLTIATVSPANVAWDSQSASAGPETAYDLVSGSLGPGTGIIFSAASCLQPGGPASYSDGRPDPATGQSYWYLSRAANSCGVGTYGSVQRDTAIPPCP